MAALLQVPGYDDDDPGDHDKSPVPPLTNPPPDHKLLTHLYDTFDERAAQWLTTAFLLTMAIVIPITGYLLQRFNTRPVFIAAMSLFTAGTAISATAPRI